MRTREPDAGEERSGTPPSGRPPGPLSERTAAGMAEAVVAYHAQFHDLFARREQRAWSAFYLRGQLAALERKTIEPMVLALKPRQGDDRAAVRAVQQFLGEGAWDDARVRERLQALVAEALGAPEGLLIVDGSGFPKQGPHSVGVAHQYCGHVGKIANCQHGVCRAYASVRGCTFVDRRLYMPEAWFDEAHAAERARCGVPAALRFETEPALGLTMVRGVVERGALPVRWVLADETYGADPKFLDGVAALDRWYFVEVPVSTRVWGGTIAVEPPGQGPLGRPRTRPRAAPGTPKPQEVRALAAALPAAAWRRRAIKTGAQGEIAADFAWPARQPCTPRRTARAGSLGGLPPQPHARCPRDADDQVLPDQRAGDLPGGGPGARERGAVAHRGRVRGGEGRARDGPLRGADLAGVAPPHDADLPRAPPAPPAAGAGGKIRP